MAFLIRTVTVTAEGREIVRETRVDRDTIGVGRAAENALSLPDLAVDPRQAPISTRDGRRVLGVASGLAFEVDGRSTRRTEIDSAKGAELAFGGHRVTVSRSGGDVGLAGRRG